MSDLNHLILFGHITKNASMRFVNGKVLVEFCLANNYVVKDENEEFVEKTNFFFITIWGKVAEHLFPYLVKGLALNVEGCLRQDSWEDEDGKRHSRLRIVTTRLHFAGPLPKGAKKNASDDKAKAPVDAAALAKQSLDVEGEVIEDDDVVNEDNIPVSYANLPKEDETKLRN